MKEIVAYLNFDGQAKEAMEFYKNCLGGELRLMSFGDVPGEMPPGAKDRIMHASLSTATGTLMASDTMPGQALQRGNGISISLHCDSAEEIERVFAALGEGGTIKMPLTDMFWGGRFGELTDKFGVSWLFNYQFQQPMG